MLHLLLGEGFERIGEKVVDYDEGDLATIAARIFTIYFP